MKNFYFILLTILVPVVSLGQVILTENFTYPDGSLVGNGAWDTHSGTAGDFQITSGQALIQHGTPSEDVHLTFSPVTGSIFFAFDFSIDDLGSPYTGTDNEYFAHFMEGASSFTAKLDIVAPSGSGDFTVGISTFDNTAEATWNTDLNFDTTYRVTVEFNQDTDQATLWIDATNESDASIVSSDQTDPDNSITAFAFRQSDSSENETIRVDNLVIAQSFTNTLSTAKTSPIEDFKIYPNPSQSNYITLSNKTNTELNVSILDVLGKTVFKGYTINKKINVSGLKTGIYILKAKEGDAVSNKKLVIR